jgi:hypothetical protein
VGSAVVSSAARMLRARARVSPQQSVRTSERQPAASAPVRQRLGGLSTGVSQCASVVVWEWVAPGSNFGGFARDSLVLLTLLLPARFAALS